MQTLTTKLHFHTEASRYDSSAKLKKMCERAKELGFTTLGLTEHGVLTNSFDFMEICESLGIKGIPGVEAYIGEHHSHLCLFPLTEKGYFAIGKAVSESYNTVTDSGLPIMTKEILQTYFGEGSQGHNEVVASSACVGGVLANIYNQNRFIESKVKTIEKTITEKQNHFLESLNKKGNGISYEEAVMVYQNCETLKEQISILQEQKKEHKKTASKKATKEKRIFDAFKEVEEGYSIAEKNYREKLELIEQAKKKCEEIDNQINEMRSVIANNKKITDIIKNIKKSQETPDKDGKTIYSLNLKKEELLKKRLPETELYEKTKKEAEEFLSIFGEGNFYVELQYHGIPLEKEIMPKLLEIAKELHLPTIVTNDEHMVTNTEKELLAREYIRAMRYNKWYPLTKEDEELYLKSEKELKKKLSEIFEEEDIQQAFRGCEEIAERSHVVFTKETHYPVFPCDTSSGEYLTKMCYDGIKERYKEGEWTEVHQQRLDRELDVIIKMGYADYHCITADYLVYGKIIGKIDFSKYQKEFEKDPYNIEYLKTLVEDTKGVGEGIGPGRGSAAGSLVCFLIGITDIDPIKYNLLFERFLNVERVSMPDIDSDFSPDIREKVIDYVRYKYGEEAVCMILTYGSMQAKKAIRNVARIHGLKKHDNNMYYAPLADEICKAIPKELNICFKDFLYDTVIKSEDGSEVIQQGLLSSYKGNQDAIEILNIAQTLEGTFVDYGMHAAGVVIADNHPVNDYIPLMCNDGKNWVCQCAKERVEDRGLLKMDFLGLKNLKVITNTLRMIQENTGKRIEIDKIPFDDKNVINLYARGFTNAVFQVESEGMKNVNKDFEPENFEDIILIIAVYRPGPMDFIPDIIRVKKGLQKPDYPIPEMGEILDVTYGFPVYQEQIMEIFHRFAGFSLGKADIVRRYMSKKKVDAFLAFKDEFVDGFIKNGSSKEAAENYWESLINFSKYAFNKSHATAYAVVSYQTAWLKYYYPREFLGCYLSDLDTDGISEKIRNLLLDLKEVGYSITPPDINHSQKNFSIYKDELNYGLASIRGMNDGVDEIIEDRIKNGPFSSIFDFIIRIKPKKQILVGLINSGAFDAYHNRYDLMDESFITELLNAISSLKKKKTEKTIKEMEEYIYSMQIPHRSENEEELLETEKHYLGTYLSRNPLSNLPSPHDIGCEEIGNIIPSKKVMISGMITDLKIVKQKKDNRDIAFFQLEDNTGGIDCCCFANEYERVKKQIRVGNKIMIEGSVKKEIDQFRSTDDTVVEVQKMYVKNITPIQTAKEDILLYIKNIIDWTENIYPVIKDLAEPNGHSLLLIDEMTQRVRKTEIRIKELPDCLKNRKA